MVEGMNEDLQAFSISTCSRSSVVCTPGLANLVVVGSIEAGYIRVHVLCGNLKKPSSSKILSPCF